jgi:tellurite methyltransferase
MINDNMISDNMINDKLYWEKYYEHKKIPFSPSLFAQYVIKHYVKPNDFVIELGCGNGRDAVYFANQCIQTLAFDQCENELEFLSRAYPLPNLKFIARDFTNLDMNLQCNHVYSRFSMHSIFKEQQDTVLNWIHKVLLKKGYFLLEARGKQNELYKKGEPVTNQPDAFIYEGHFRRFLDFSETCNELERIGFHINEAIEDKGFSPFNSTDETFMRIIAQKK